MAKAKKFMVAVDVTQIFRLIKYNSADPKHRDLPVIKVDEDLAKKAIGCIADLDASQCWIKEQLGLSPALAEVDFAKVEQRLLADILGDEYIVTVEKLTKEAVIDGEQKVSEE